MCGWCATSTGAGSCVEGDTYGPSDINIRQNLSSVCPSYTNQRTSLFPPQAPTSGNPYTYSFVKRFPSSVFRSFFSSQLLCCHSDTIRSLQQHHNHHCRRRRQRRWRHHHRHCRVLCLPCMQTVRCTSTTRCSCWQCSVLTLRTQLGTPCHQRASLQLQRWAKLLRRTTSRRCTSAASNATSSQLCATSRPATATAATAAASSSTCISHAAGARANGRVRVSCIK